MAEKQKKKTALYVGKETFGNLSKEEAFQKALEPYFVEEKRELVS